MEKDIGLITNHRYVEKAMVKRVIEINNSKMDALFGITNTRLQNIFNIEQDFIVQYYALRNNRGGNSFVSVFCNSFVPYKDEE
jgi:hypothetical protein